MNGTTALMIEAERYLENGDVDRAAECFRQANELEEGRRSPAPAIGLARVALILGRLDDAQRIVEQVLGQHPTSAEALTYRGVVADARQTPEVALQFLEQAVAADETYAPAHANLGRVRGQLGQWTEALRAFRTAHALAPRQPVIVPLLALAAVRTGALEEAIELLAKHLEQTPNHLDAIVALVDTLVEAKMEEHAAELLANAVERMPQVAVLHARQSALALRRGDLSLARSAAAHHVTLTPTDQEALLYAATLSLMALNLDQAEAYVQRALELDQGNWRVHYLLGLIYDSLRIKGPARVAYRMAMKHGPRAWQPRINLAALLLEEHSPAAAREARTLLEEALALGADADAPDARYTLALAHWQLGEKRASENAARRAAAHTSTDSPVVTSAKRFLGNFSAAHVSEGAHWATASDGWRRYT